MHTNLNILLNQQLSTMGYVFQEHLLEVGQDDREEKLLTHNIGGRLILFSGQSFFRHVELLHLTHLKRRN